MPIFNPQVSPTQDPNYLNYAKVVDAPPPNQSSAIKVNTLASGLDSAVGFIDTELKKSIQSDAYSAVDKKSAEFVSALENIKGNLDKGVIPPPVATVTGSTAGNSILDANAMVDESEIPPGLSSGLDRIDRLAQAKMAGSPKLNDTQFSKDTRSIAKELRSTYGEGYRQYIDEQVSKASGLPVANSYQNNLLIDINRQLAQTKTAKDDVVTMMEKNSDVPNMGQYYQRYNNGDPTITKTMIFKKVADWNNLQSQLKIDAARRAEDTGSQNDQIKAETATITKRYNDAVGMYTGDIKNLSGMPGLGATMKYVQEVQAGMHPEATDAEVKQRVYQLQAYRQGIDMQLKQMGRPSEMVIGSPAAETLRKNALAPIDTLITLANDKDASPAMYHLHMQEAIKNDDLYNWLTSTDKGALSRQMIVGRSVMGEQYFPDWIRTIVSTPDANGKTLDQPIKDVFSQQGMNAIVPLEDKRGQPLPSSLTGAIQHGKQVGIPDANYYGHVVGLVSNLVDPKMPLDVKDRLIGWAFDPKHGSALDELKTDYTDPSTGENVPGKYHAFNILSAKGITDAVKSTAAVHPENYDMYRNTLETEFGKLYRSDVASLNTALDKTTIGGGKRLDVHFSFNADTNQFGLVDNNNRPITYSKRAEFQYGADAGKATALNTMVQTLDRVNKGLGNLVYMHQNDPTDQNTSTGKYLLQAMQTLHFRTGGELPGATPDMMKALIKANSPELSKDELDKAVFGLPRDLSKYTPEQDASLGSFLRSPAGNAQPGPQFVSNPRNAPLPKQPTGIHGNLSDEPLLGIQTDDIPEGMSARDFIKQLQAGRR